MPNDAPPLCWPQQPEELAPRFRPYYRWLQACILSLINRKLWPPGQRIPNEVDIAQSAKLNVNTVKKALLELAGQGYLVRSPRKGTFVAGYRDISYRYIFYSMGEGFSRAPTSYNSAFELLRVERVRDKDFPAEFPGGQEQIKIFRRLYFKNTPAVYSISWLRSDLAPEFDRIPIQRFGEQPLYSLMEQEYSIVIRESSEILSAVRANARVAELLALKQGDPVILSKILNYTDGKEVCEYRESYINTANFYLQRNF